MARILQFDEGKHGNPANVDAAKVWQYVVRRLDFPLPDFISDEIDRIIGEIWNSSDARSTYYDCVSALDSLEPSTS